ncbi:MAG: DUF2306 domain-containing protein [Trueperaceae bacterium]
MDWLVPALLVMLSAVPVVAGALRLSELATGGEITADNARFFANPLPVALHIVSASFYSVLGAFQFSPAVRRGWPQWHRGCGRILVPLGLLTAMSGLWMTLFYPAVPGGAALYFIRLVVGSAMIAAITLAIMAIRNQNFPAHGAWMTRAYALGLGAGTQVLTYLLWSIAVGAENEFGRLVVMAGGWAINIAVAEWVIVQRSRRRAGQKGRRPAIASSRS